MMYSDEEQILPTNDLIFKRIFWNKEYPNILISFINSILKRDDPIKSVELIGTEMDDKFIGEQGIRLDLVAETSTNEILNIEMQKENNDDMRKRTLFYWARLYTSQLKKGQYYKDLHPVIAINILDFNLFEDNRCNRNFILKDEKTNEEYIRMLDIHFVELTKRKYVDQSDKLWAWVEFLKSPNSKNLIARRHDNEFESIFNAKEIFDTTIADPVQKEKILLLEKTQMDNLSAVDYAKTKGKEEGIKEGLEKGKLDERRKLVLNMKSQGFDDDTIAKCLNINIEDLKSLLK